MTTKFKPVAVTDEFEQCFCCGKQGLKRVVMMQPFDEDGNRDGQAIPFGTTCAARELGWDRPAASSTKRAVEDWAIDSMKQDLKELGRELQAQAVVESHQITVNRWGVSAFVAQVNGQEVRIEGRHVTNGTCTIESLCQAVKGLWVGRHPRYQEAYARLLAACHR